MCRRRGAVRCGAVRCGAVRCGAVRCGAVRCGARGRLKCSACSTYIAIDHIKRHVGRERGGYGLRGCYGGVEDGQHGGSQDPCHAQRRPIPTPAPRPTPHERHLRGARMGRGGSPAAATRGTQPRPCGRPALRIAGRRPFLPLSGQCCSGRPGTGLSMLWANTGRRSLKKREN